MKSILLIKVKESIRRKSLGKRKKWIINDEHRWCCRGRILILKIIDGGKNRGRGGKKSS